MNNKSTHNCNPHLKKIKYCLLRKPNNVQNSTQSSAEINIQEKQNCF